MLKLYRSKDFRPTFGHLAEIRTLVPSGTPLMVCTATASRIVKKEVIDCLEMRDCAEVTASLDRPGEWQSREKWRRCCFHIYWKPVDCPVRKQPATLRDHERITVRRYLENATICRRKWILGYFDVQLNAEASRCCNNCSNNTVVSQD